MTVITTEHTVSEIKKILEAHNTSPLHTAKLALLFEQASIHVYPLIKFNSLCRIVVIVRPVCFYVQITRHLMSYSLFVCLVEGLFELPGIKAPYGTNFHLICKQLIQKHGKYLTSNYSIFL